MSRHFPVAVVVSVFRDRLLCPFEDYREFLDYMTGVDELRLYDLAPARRAVAAHVEEVLPEIRNIPDLPEKTDSGNANRYVKSCAKALGQQLITLDPLPVGAFRPRRVEEAFNARYQ